MSAPKLHARRPRSSGRKLPAAGKIDCTPRTQESHGVMKRRERLGVQCRELEAPFPARPASSFASLVRLPGHLGAACRLPPLLWQGELSEVQTPEARVPRLVLQERLHHNPGSCSCQHVPEFAKFPTQTGPNRPQARGEVQRSHRRRRRRLHGVEGIHGGSHEGRGQAAAGQAGSVGRAPVDEVGLTRLNAARASRTSPKCQVPGAKCGLMPFAPRLPNQHLAATRRVLRRLAYLRMRVGAEAPRRGRRARPRPAHGPKAGSAPGHRPPAADPPGLAPRTCTRSPP